LKDKKLNETKGLENDLKNRNRNPKSKKSKNRTIFIVFPIVNFGAKLNEKFDFNSILCEKMRGILKIAQNFNFPKKYGNSIFRINGLTSYTFMPELYQQLNPLSQLKKA
jgi:hypothetical protein